MANEEANSGAATVDYYDVFPSFRGLDIRNTFADFLYVFMKNRGIRVFWDDEELRPGEKISEILQAVENSQTYIPIFSQNYASSRWCLRELTHMVECCGRSPGKKILPIFLDVDPSDVKLDTDLYKSHLRKHEKELGCTAVKPWKEALTTVGRLKRWHIKDKGWGEVIEDITKEVSRNITIRKRDLPPCLVGIDDRVEDIKRLLSCHDTSDVRFVIIYGIGGMGTTTLANAVFNQLSPQFEGHFFLSDIRDLGNEKILEKLVAGVFHFAPETLDVERRKNVIRETLPKKRVLLVFDGMDENDQSMQLAKYCNLCDPGSRIIITTTNKSVFSIIEAEGFKENISTRSTNIIQYEMKTMHLDHALQLFSKHAFKTDSAPPDLYDLSKEAVELTGGLPLAIEMMGSHLSGRSKAQWISTLDKWKNVPHQKVLQRFKISFDALEYRQQQIFLDIACFFVNKKVTNAMYMWEALSFDPRVEMEVLVNKCMIKIDHNRFLMPKQLMLFGWETIFQTEDQSRLWYLEMAREKKTKNAVALTPRRSGHIFTRQELLSLNRVRFLALDGGNFASNHEDILWQLRWLCWRDCPLKLQANDFVLNKLVILKLSGEITAEEWSRWGEIIVLFHLTYLLFQLIVCMYDDMHLQGPGIIMLVAVLQVPSELKVLHLSGSKSLIETPHFSELMNLERLILEDFPLLAKIDPTIGKLKQLIYLKIKRCPGLRGLPREIGCLIALKELILISGCSVCNLPDSIGNLRLMSRLVVEDAGLVELPDTIKGLVGLEYLSLANCMSLNLLPDAIGELKSLTKLDLSGTTIRDSIGKLEDLTSRIEVVVG